MDAASFFKHLADDGDLLVNHGFASCPDNMELLRTVCDLEEGLHVLARSFGREITKDYRGRWIVLPAPKGDDRNGQA